ncbi:hypothetical protein IBX65_07615 [Candidatus Aerophobetes bacterium]|nr:hypothetical protein [Candidatus Aerophobetes bacterium]
MNKKHKMIENILDEYLKRLKKGEDPSVRNYLKDYPYSKKELKEVLLIARCAYWKNLSDATSTPSTSFFLSLRERLIKTLKDRGTLK